MHGWAFSPFSTGRPKVDRRVDSIGRACDGSSRRYSEMYTGARSSIG